MTTLRISCPCNVTLVGIVNGNVSTYVPGDICMVTGPPVLASAACRA